MLKEYVQGLYIRFRLNLIVNPAVRCIDFGDEVCILIRSTPVKRCLCGVGIAVEEVSESMPQEASKTRI